jgi:hypothetical protein
VHHGQAPVERAHVRPGYFQRLLVSTNVVYLMIVGHSGIGALERSVRFGDILEFPFAIAVRGDIGMKALGEGPESRLDLGA